MARPLLLSTSMGTVSPERLRLAGRKGLLAGEVSKKRHKIGDRYVLAGQDVSARSVACLDVGWIVVRRPGYHLKE
jgi:hypothetical protein